MRDSTISRPASRQALGDRRDELRRRIRIGDLQPGSVTGRLDGGPLPRPGPPRSASPVPRFEWTVDPEPQPRPEPRGELRRTSRRPRPAPRPGRRSGRPAARRRRGRGSSAGWRRRRPAAPRSSSRTTARASGSMPAVGSSRIRTSGRPTSASARPSRCRSPPDRRRNGVDATVRRPSSVQQLVRVARIGVEPGVLDRSSRAVAPAGRCRRTGASGPRGLAASDRRAPGPPRGPAPSRRRRVR